MERQTSPITKLVSWFGWVCEAAELSDICPAPVTLLFTLN